MSTDTGIDPTTTLGPELTVDEERSFLEREVRANFDMSLADFKRRWRAGEFRDDKDPRYHSVGMLLD